MDEKTQEFWLNVIQPRLDEGLKQCYFCMDWFRADGSHRLCFEEKDARAAGYLGAYGNPAWNLDGDGY